MDNMREEFEAWVKDTFNIDCSEMFFGIKGRDEKEQYYDDDEDGAIAVSAMFYAWQASRAALCVELPSMTNNGYDGFYRSSEVVRSLKSSGVTYK